MRNKWKPKFRTFGVVTSNFRDLNHSMLDRDFEQFAWTRGEPSPPLKSA